MKKEYPKIRMSNKCRFRIKAAVKKAFNEIAIQYGCSDSPQEVWTHDVKELWDILQNVETKAIRNIEDIIEKN